MPNPSLKSFKSPSTIGVLSISIIAYIFAAISFPIISDEFHEAVEVYNLFKKVPYKDYFYYKNVLGYYIKYPFLHIFNDWFTSILLSRLVLGLAWVITLFYFLKETSRSISEKSFLISFLLGAFLTNNLLHAASYRVDLLTTLFGLGSYLFLNKRKFFWSGIFASLSFFVSQKGIWFCLAGFLSLIFIKETRKSVIPYLRGGILIGFIYVGVFSLFSSPREVLYGIFFKDLGMAASAGYQIRHFWSQSFFENWPFWLTSGAGASLVLLTQTQVQKKALIYFTSFIFMFACNPQSWPYNFVFITPFLCFFSLFFWESFFSKEIDPRIKSLITVTAIIIPVFNLYSGHRLTNGHQREVVSNLERVLNKEDTYIAGFNILPNNKQAHPFFNWLNAIERSKAFKLTGNETKNLINEWKEKPAKALIKNYRMYSLPPIIMGYLEKNYSHFWGNLYLKSIELSLGERGYPIPFKGKYILLPNGTSKAPEIIIGEKEFNVGESIELEKGILKINALKPGKLMFFPGEMNLSLKYKQETNLNLTYD